MAVSAPKQLPLALRALTHPLRVAALHEYGRDGPVSPSQVATALDAKLGDVSYHTRTLHALGMLQLVRTVPRRGAVEHYYKVSESGRRALAWLEEL